MKKRFLALFQSLRQAGCSHVCSLYDMSSTGPPTDPNRVVSAPCRKCGKILKADCGLNLGCSWTQEPALLQQPLH